MWVQSCWKPVHHVEAYDNPAILAVAASVPEEMSASWEQAAAQHRGQPTVVSPFRLIPTQDPVSTRDVGYH